jgi:hypothetical protein
VQQREFGLPPTSAAAEWDGRRVDHRQVWIRRAAGADAWLEAEVEVRVVIEDAMLRLPQRDPARRRARRAARQASSSAA